MRLLLLPPYACTSECLRLFATAHRDRRLGADEGGIESLKANPFWQSADWELVEHKRLPSPLKVYASRVAERHKEAKPLKAAEREALMKNEFISSFVASQRLHRIPKKKRSPSQVLCAFLHPCARRRMSLHAVHASNLVLVFLVRG